MALTKRAQQALAVLSAGGKFRKALETTYHGEKFMMRLRDENGQVVKGFGFQTFYELLDAGALLYVHPHDSVSSAWPQEWFVCPEGQAPSVQ